MQAIDGRPTIVAQVSTPKAQNKPQPLPQQLLQQEPHRGWSDTSSSNAGSSQKKGINCMPKPKAVREKFIFDPEHGGGRRRRDKHLPKRKFYEENSDKIGDRLDFQMRRGLDCIDESPCARLRGNDEEVHQAGANIRGLSVESKEANDIPFEIAKDAQDGAHQFKIDPSLFYNDSGEAEFIKSQEGNFDFGGQNMISPQQVHDLLCQRYQAKANAPKSAVPNFIIIDCRFDYEFAGGHIQGAVNISSPEELKDFLFSSKERLEELMAQRTMLIFHCEFSQKRAPFMYSCLRDNDRRCNIDAYPRLFFPEIYVMEGGYCAFWQSYKDTPLVWKPGCTPAGLEPSGQAGYNINEEVSTAASHGYTRQADACDKMYIKQYAVLATNKKQRLHMPKLL